MPSGADIRDSAIAAIACHFFLIPVGVRSLTMPA